MNKLGVIHFITFHNRSQQRLGCLNISEKEVTSSKQRTARDTGAIISRNLYKDMKREWERASDLASVFLSHIFPFLCLTRSAEMFNWIICYLWKAAHRPEQRHKEKNARKCCTREIGGRKSCVVHDECREGGEGKCWRAATATGDDKGIKIAVMIKNANKTVV